ncbi:MAG: tyrosine phosphatase family protein [Rhizobium sp.]|nr:tyrosine phosphatase family protein [Rhizobium sp.]
MFNTHYSVRRILLLGLLLAGSPIVAVSSYLGIQYLRGNVHEVDPGQLYRSGQLNASQIRDVTKRYGIRSIVNLRGASPKAKWYQDELAEAKALGLTHVDFKMLATRQLPLERAAALEAALRDVPKPVLIHCEGGSDRSGLASAIFMHRIRGMDIEKAEGQISLYYGHFSVPHLSQAYPMDETWEKLEDLYRTNEREARL